MNTTIDISENIDIINGMDYVMIFKALSNETRLQMLHWLKEPELHFPPSSCNYENFPGGICVGQIQEKAGLSQSTTSQYLAIMQRAGLLEARRFGQWTYYRRNEEMLHKLATYFREEL
ncbi:ArsR family transcriptional regulator [Brevibacillus laterosporus PE36]|nr:ArsR family transcriptional regulator [Brevibacillus laterosporus PE36]